MFPGLLRMGPCRWVRSPKHAAQPRGSRVSLSLSLLSQNLSQSGHFALLSVTQLFTPFPTKKLGPRLTPSWLDLDYGGKWSQNHHDLNIWLCIGTLTNTNSHLFNTLIVTFLSCKQRRNFIWYLRKLINWCEFVLFSPLLTRFWSCF